MVIPASKALVTVLISVKNGAAYLDTALSSLAAQTLRDFEIILIDNGSTDLTPSIISKWQTREPRLRTVRWPNMSLSACLRRGAQLVATPFLARLDADDVAHPERLQRQLETMVRRPYCIVSGTNSYLIDGGGKRIGSLRYPSQHSELVSALRDGCPFVHSSIMMRTDAYRAAGGYRRGLSMSEDYDLLSRMAELGEVANLPEALTSYRIHGSSITMRKPLRMALTSLCVAAAQKARSGGRAEPFVNGVPNLRRAQRELDISRAEARRLMRTRVLRHRLSRHFLMLPLPLRAKSLIRECAHRLGPRSLYLAVVHLSARDRGAALQPVSKLPG